MSMAVGERIPTLNIKTWDQGPAAISTDEVFADKTVVMFGVPGAFTPVCSLKHLPGFVEHLAAFKAAGVDSVVGHAVNDPFVMHAWAKSASVGDGILMLADWNADLARALGVDADMSAAGLGTRAKRYALIAQDKTIRYLEVGELEVSGAGAVLDALKAL